jgi:peptidoglycan hydrolase CwlO-like protein
MRTPVRTVRARRSVGATLTVMLLAAVALPAMVAAPAAAQSTSNASTDVATLRAQADDIANQYFRALTRSHDLESEITRNSQLVDDLEAKAKVAKDNARARALLAYTTSSDHLATLIQSHNVLDTARRAQLIGTVNARDNAVYAKLHSTTEDLRAKRKDLEGARTQQATVLAQIQEQAAAMDAKLAEAEQRQQAEAAAAAAADQAARSAAAASATTTTAKPAPTAPPTKPTTPTVPPNYTGTPGTNPHHDDPFLTCVRARESGGNYGAVNPAGPYLGAYQFYQATWNGAANHAGRSDLVGVPANLASPYDQDDVAWSLYQWQGEGPWGGSCG